MTSPPPAAPAPSEDPASDLPLPRRPDDSLAHPLVAPPQAPLNLSNLGVDLLSSNSSGIGPRKLEAVESWIVPSLLPDCAGVRYNFSRALVIPTLTRRRSASSDTVSS